MLVDDVERPVALEREIQVLVEILLVAVDDVIVLDGSGRVGRIPGGYEAWEQQRRAARRRPKVGSKPKTGRQRPGRDGPSPSTLRNRRKLIDRQLAAAEAERSRLQAELDRIAASGGHGELARLGTELAAAAAEVDKLEEEWLEVSEQLES